MPSIERATRCRRQQAAQHPDRRRLAGAVAAEKAEHLTAPHVETDVVDGVELAETARELIDDDGAIGGGHCATERPDQPRLVESQLDLQARALDLGFDQVELGVEDVGAGGDAGGKPLVRALASLQRPP